jgi:uncharacterized membrane protein
MRRILRILKQSVIAGTLVLIPAATSIFILYKLFVWLDNVLPSVLNVKLPPGSGLLAIVLITLVAGLLARHYLGKRLIDMVTNLIAHVPVLNKLYMTVQQVVDLISKPKTKAFSKVVMVEYPRRDSWVLAFVTSRETEEISDAIGQKLICVYVPTAPNPTSGFTLYVPETDVREVALTPEIAVKAIVSVGMVSSAKSYIQEPARPLPNFAEWLKGIFRKRGKGKSRAPVLWS